MCCECCSVRQQKIWVFTIATLAVVVGIVLITAWPAIAKKIIEGQLPLTPSSYTFSKWEVTPIELYLTFYLYNWTNSHEASNPNIKPHFEELGPYAFREFKVKEDLVWHTDNSTVTYYARRTWHFDPDKSNGKLEDIVIAPNLPTVAAARFTRKMRKFLRKCVNFGLNREGGGLIMQHTAIEWLFHGFYDDIFDFVERLHSPILPVYSNEFAWFYQRNNSKEAEGTYNIHTGKRDLSQMGDLKKWKGSDHTGYWSGECGRVNGSTGDLWTPGKKWDETISIFISDAARFINLFPQKKVNYHGVEGWLYKSTDQTFDSGYIAEDTKCFCVKGLECPKNGVIDYSPVALRAPVYMSHPHFYMTDPLYLENTTGMDPDPEKHGIYVVMEPTLGVPLELLGQVLLSLRVEPDDQIDYLRDLAHYFYAPLFVIQIKAEIPDDILDNVKLALSVPLIGQYTGIAFTSMGVVMLAVAVWLTVTHNWRGDAKKNNSDGDGEPAKTEHVQEETEHEGMNVIKIQQKTTTTNQEQTKTVNEEINEIKVQRQQSSVLTETLSSEKLF